MLNDIGAADTVNHGGSKMKQIYGLIFSLLATTSLHAQEAEMRSEFMYCKLKDGKTMDDVRAQSKRYGEFSKEQGTNYAQAIMMPMHAGDTSGFDYILWGTWPDGAAMYEEWGSFANGYGGWVEENSDGSSGGAVSDCNRSYATFDSLVSRVAIPAEERDAKRPVQFSNCSLKDGVTIDQVYAQAAINRDAMEEGGFSGWATSYLFPYMGFDGNQSFDFVLANYWYSFESRAYMANNWLEFVEDNPEIEGKMQLLVSCQGSRSFVYESTFNNLR